MDFTTIVVTAFALAMDAFAVAAVAAASINRVTFRHTFRLAWHFGLFQALMPVIGWFGGSAISSFMATYAYLTASGLLGFIGLRMIWEARRPDQKKERYDPTRGWSLIGLSIATSIDALAAGVSFGLLDVSIWTPAAIIGITTIALTYAGIRIGRFAGEVAGIWAERAGGVILILLALRISTGYQI